MDFRKLMLFKAAIGSDNFPTEEATATGNPATFTTDIKKPLEALTVTFNPVQEGSGTASPTNVRPITGLSSVEIKHSGKNTSKPTVYELEFPDGTKYGGELDIVNGTLKIEWLCLTYTGKASESWNVENGINFYIMTPSKLKRDTQGSSDLRCNRAQSQSNLFEGCCRITSSGNFNIKIGPLIGISTVAAFKEWLASNPVQIVAKLATPDTISVDPITIKTLKGENNIWADSCDSVTIKYLKKKT